MPPHVFIGIESWCVGKLLRIFFINMNKKHLLNWGEVWTYPTFCREVEHHIG